MSAFNSKEEEITKSNSNESNKNHIIVFSDEDPDESQEDTPINIGIRQPSFLKLKGDPIPKGYDSIESLRKEKTLIRVQPFIEDNDSPDQNIIEILAKRNAKKWESIGFNPNAIPLQRPSTMSVFSIPSSEFIDMTASSKFSSSFSTIDSIKPVNISSHLPSLEEKIPIQSEFPNSTKHHHKRSPSVDSDRQKPSIFRLSHFSGKLSESPSLSSRIPPSILPFISHPPNSPTYLALSMTPPILSRSSLSSVAIDLSYYFNLAVDNGLRSEASYIQQSLDYLMAVNSLTETERDALVEESELRALSRAFQQDAEGLDAHFMSDIVMASYFTESENLKKLRDELKSALKQQNMGRIAAASKQIQALSAKERSAAKNRLVKDITHAADQLKRKYQVKRILIRKRHDEEKRKVGRKSVNLSNLHLESLQKNGSNLENELSSAPPIMRPKIPVSQPRNTYR